LEAVVDSVEAAAHRLHVDAAQLLATLSEAVKDGLHTDADSGHGEDVGPRVTTDWPASVLDTPFGGSRRNVDTPFGGSRRNVLDTPYSLGMLDVGTPMSLHPDLLGSVAPAVADHIYALEVELRNTLMLAGAAEARSAWIESRVLHTARSAADGGHVEWDALVAAVSPPKIVEDLGVELDVDAARSLHFFGDGNSGCNDVVGPGEGQGEGEVEGELQQFEWNEGGSEPTGDSVATPNSLPEERGTSGTERVSSDGSEDDDGLAPEDNSIVAGTSASPVSPSTHMAFL
jgi:hypothetical protein